MFVALNLQILVIHDGGFVSTPPAADYLQPRIRVSLVISPSISKSASDYCCIAINKHTTFAPGPASRRPKDSNIFPFILRPRHPWCRCARVSFVILPTSHTYSSASDSLISCDVRLISLCWLLIYTLQSKGAVSLPKRVGKCRRCPENFKLSFFSD